MYVRNVGLKVVIGEVVIFLDDDVELDWYWFLVIFCLFFEKNVVVVGGKVFVFGVVDLLDWLFCEYGYFVSVFDLFDSVCEIDKVMGVNFVL